MLANSSATANEISGGRISLGMGTGWMEAEHEAFGFPFPPMAERLALFREQIEAVRGFWDGKPRPRLIVGGSALSGTVVPAAASRTSTTRSWRRPRSARPGARDRARLRARGARADPLSLMTGCAIGRDGAEARERIGRRLERAGQEIDPDEYKAQRGSTAVLGTVEEASERLRAYEAAGVERVMLQHLDHEDLDMVELIGRELVPGGLEAK